MSPGLAASAPLVLVLLTACVASEGDEDTQDALTTALRSAADTDRQVNLADVVEGDWGRLVFVCPYEDEQEVEERLGFAWEEFPGADDAGDAVTYVFASEDGVTTWATVRRDLGDPCGGSKAPRTVPRSSAVFSLEQTDTTSGSEAFYSLVQRR